MQKIWVSPQIYRMFLCIKKTPTLSKNYSTLQSSSQPMLQWWPWQKKSLAAKLNSLNEWKNNWKIGESKMQQSLMHQDWTTLILAKTDQKALEKTTKIKCLLKMWPSLPAIWSWISQKYWMYQVLRPKCLAKIRNHQWKWSTGTGCSQDSLITRKAWTD